MKKKLISGVLIVCMLLGLMAFPVQGSSTLENGDSIYDPVLVQDLTGPRFPGLNVQEWDDDLVYYTNGYHSGLMDVYGNEILPPVYDLFSRVSGSYMSGAKNNVAALFYKGRQLTEFRYTNITKKLLCFRAEDVNAGTVFLDDNGKQIPVPKVWNGDWILSDISPGKAILLYQEHYYYYSDILGGLVYEPAHYMLLDWKGKTIVGDTQRDIKLRDADSYTLGANYWQKTEHFFFDGSAVKGVPEGYYEAWMQYFPNSQYIILQKRGSADGGYYLYDTDYNPICKLEVMTNAIEPLAAVSDTLLIVRTPEGDSILMNAKGQEVSRLPGWFVSYLGVERKGITEPLDHFLMCDGENGYIYDQSGTLISVLEGATSVKNADYYITANIGEYDRALYDLDGNLLFTYNVDDGIRCVDGIILQERGNASAVLGKDGTPLTDFVFYPYFNAGDCGFMKVKISGKKGFYLINNRGQVLNSQGFDEFTYIESSYCEYKTGGKTGFLRIVLPGDDLFTDVPYGTWYYDSVEACAEMELFNGTSPAKFSPNKPMTRAMLVTVLWRLDGEKAPTEKADFADVPSDSWFADAVAWASENGIVNGVGKGNFNPNGNVTREQMATILRRYAESKGLDISKEADLSSYPDADQISDYATAAMAWANGTGLINGNKIDGTIFLQPKGNATRAQVAAILIRYINNLTTQ